jgi:hypothetical protein
VTTGGQPWVYDTLDHQIGGFGQQQGGGQSITFTSQYGTVNLSTLPVVSRDGVIVPPSPIQSATALTPVPDSPSAVRPSFDIQPTQSFAAAELPLNQKSGEDVIATLERLGGLMEKGYITKEEFAAKKSELLNRI